MNKQYNNFKLSLILLIPFGSLIGISILFNVYNDYLKMAASQYNYDYLYICLFRLLEALILFISILVYMKDIQKEDNKLIYLIEGVQIISFIMIIIISSFMVNIYILIFPLLNYLFLWILVIAYRIYKQTSNKKKKSYFRVKIIMEKKGLIKKIIVFTIGIIIGMLIHSFLIGKI